MNIYSFGNIDLDNDSIQLKIIPRLEELFPDINFHISDPNENIFEYDRNPVILDACEGIDKCVIISDTSKLFQKKIYLCSRF